MSRREESIAVFLDAVRQRKLAGDTSLRQAWKEYDDLLQSKWKLHRKDPTMVENISQSLKSQSKVSSVQLPTETSVVAFHLHSIIEPGRTGELKEYDEALQELAFLMSCHIRLQTQVSTLEVPEIVLTQSRPASNWSRESGVISELSDENETLKEKIREKDVEIDEIISSHIQRGRLLHECRQTIAQQEKELERLRKQVLLQQDQIDKVSSRLSGASTSDLSNGDQTLTSAISRRKLADDFCDIYTNEWRKALESMKSSYSEEEFIMRLSRIIQSAFTFCQKSSRSQLTIINDHLQFLATSPLQYAAKHILGSPSKDSEIRTLSEKFSKEFLNMSASASLNWLKRLYAEQKQDFLNLESRDIVAPITERLIESFWIMNTQDPPMVVQFANEGDIVNTDYFSFYERAGEKVKLCVWPAVFEHDGGILLSKGRVICKPLS